MTSDEKLLEFNDDEPDCGVDAASGHRILAGKSRQEKVRVCLGKETDFQTSGFGKMLRS